MHSARRNKRCERCYDFCERSAIHEFEGGLSRNEAEELARIEICAGCEYDELQWREDNGIAVKGSRCGKGKKTAGLSS